MYVNINCYLNYPAHFLKVTDTAEDGLVTKIVESGVDKRIEYATACRYCGSTELSLDFIGGYIGSSVLVFLVKLVLLA